MPRTRKMHDLTDEQLEHMATYYENRRDTTRSEDRRLRAARAARDYRAEQVARKLKRGE
jgi:hypothetical protein